MHAGQLIDLEAVLNHYNQAEIALIGHNEAEPLDLTGKELQQIVAFLHALTGTIEADSRWLSPPP